jgi:hypothetical protein
MTKRAKKHSHKSILKLAGLEHSKSAVLNSLFSLSSRVLTIALFGTSSTGTAPSRA